jgi:hypothetical protein
MIKNFARARSEKDITRVSGTLSTGSIPVGRTSQNIIYSNSDVRIRAADAQSHGLFRGYRLLASSMNSGL